MEDQEHLVSEWAIQVTQKKGRTTGWSKKIKNAYDGNATPIADTIIILIIITYTITTTIITYFIHPRVP